MSEEYSAYADLRNRFNVNHESNASKLLKVKTRNNLIDILPEMGMKLIGCNLINLEDNSKVKKNTLENKFTNLTMKVKSMTKVKKSGIY